MEKKNETNSLSKLSPSFLSELVAFSLMDRGVLDICKENVQYSFLESEHHKKIFQFIYDFYELESKIPTLGVISQGLKSDSQVLKFLGEVKRSQETLNKENRDSVILQLEVFIRRGKFVQLYNKAHELFQAGKEFEAIGLMSQESVKIEEFSLVGKQYKKIFEDYAERHSKRIETATSEKGISSQKILSGITELDEITQGWKKGTSVLFMASSGKGKTTALRWLGITAARTGNVVVHFQGEGTEQECLDGYDAAWTSTRLSTFNTALYPEETQKTEKKALEVASQIHKRQGDIIVHSEETFDTISLERCREIIKNVIKEKGRVDMVIFDYLEVFSNSKKYGVGESGERKRREDIANGMTNIATEFNIVVATATQSQDISPQLYNNPDFVMTRTHASEFKGVVKPFSYFLTINMTDDEYDEDIARIHADKFRGHKSGQTIAIAQRKDIGRFYDDFRTKSEGLYNSRL